MPDTSSLFPQPPQQQQQGNSLLNNPGQAVGLMQGLQELQIRGAQAPAQMELPQAGLNIQRQELARQQAEFDTQMRRNYNSYFGNWLTTLDHEPTDKEVQTAAAGASRAYGGARSDISQKIYNEILNQKNRKAYGNTLNAQALSPAEFAQRTPAPFNPQSGATGMEPLGVATARGGSSSTPGPGTQASIDLYKQHAQQASNYQGDINALNQIIPLLKEIGPEGMGMGSDLKKKISKVVAGVSGDDDEATVRDKLDKYFAQLGMGLNPRSDEEMHQRIASNPNAHLQQRASLDVARVLLAQKRLFQAQVLEAVKPSATSAEPNPQRAGEAGYMNWSPAFNTKQDPRAFIMDSLEPEKRKAILDEVNTQRKSSNAGDRKKAQVFLDSYRVARSHPGLIDTSQFGQ